MIRALDKIPGITGRTAMAIMNRAALVLVGFTLLSVSGGAQTNSPSAPAQPVTSQVGPAFVGDREPMQNIPITSGDLLDVEIFNTPELSGKLRVDQQGSVMLPMGGSVK